MEMPAPATEINLIQTFADTTVIGLTINHEEMTKGEVVEAIAHYSAALGIPATDPLGRPAAELVDMVAAKFPEIREKLIAHA